MNRHFCKARSDFGREIGENRDLGLDTKAANRAIPDLASPTIKGGPKVARTDYSRAGSAGNLTFRFSVEVYKIVCFGIFLGTKPCLFRLYFGQNLVRVITCTPI